MAWVCPLGSPRPRGTYSGYIITHVLIGRERETINASQCWPNVSLLYSVRSLNSEVDTL